jgi:hypothetical protein
MLKTAARETGTEAGFLMDRVREFLEFLRASNLAEGNFLGLLHVLIGRRIARADGTLVSVGMTWRELASWLKKVRWHKEAAFELGLQKSTLPQRDRFRYWYNAIARARLDSPEAQLAGSRLAEKLLPAGYTVSPPPTDGRKSG